MLGLSLRFRIVVLTSLATAIILAVGGALIILNVRAEFIDAADWNANNRAGQVAELASDGKLPRRLPIEDDGETVVQVVRGDQVVSRTANAPGDEALPLPRQAPGSWRNLAVDDLPVVGSGPYRTISLGIITPEGPATVFVAVSTEDVEDVVQAATERGAVGLVLLLLPLSGLLWLAVGRTLAPVTAIRRRAETITDAHGDLRVPEPAKLDEIGRLARTINAMLARLHDSAENQRSFLADAAHELRSPVASLRAQLETAQRGGQSTAVSDLPDLMVETLRMQAMVDQLLLLARSDAGMVANVREPVDMDDAVYAVQTSVRAESRRRGVKVDLRKVAAVQVVGDPALLEQVVRNLIDNAVRHARTTVQVTLTDDREVAQLTVDDDGPGIPKRLRRRVFERFTRLDDARDRQDGGVGLGLAIVADIVQAHGGTVRVLDSPLGGARFQVKLPLGDTASQAVEPARRRSVNETLLHQPVVGDGGG